MDRVRPSSRLARERHPPYLCPELQNIPRKVVLAGRSVAPKEPGPRPSQVQSGIRFVKEQVKERKKEGVARQRKSIRLFVLSYEKLLVHRNERKKRDPREMDGLDGLDENQESRFAICITEKRRWPFLARENDKRKEVTPMNQNCPSVLPGPF